MAPEFVGFLPSQAGLETKPRSPASGTLLAEHVAASSGQPRAAAARKARPTLALPTPRFSSQFPGTCLGVSSKSGAPNVGGCSPRFVCRVHAAAV